jgi:hypothetical protein
LRIECALALSGHCSQEGRTALDVVTDAALFAQLCDESPEQRGCGLWPESKSKGAALREAEERKLMLNQVKAILGAAQERDLVVLTRLYFPARPRQLS